MDTFIQSTLLVVIVTKDSLPNYEIHMYIIIHINIYNSIQAENMKVTNLYEEIKYYINYTLVFNTLKTSIIFIKLFFLIISTCVFTHTFYHTKLRAICE
jgi:hypothetical protein